MGNKEMEAIADAMESLANRISKVEKGGGPDTAQNLTKLIQAAQRERNLLAQEHSAIEKSQAAHASEMMALREQVTEGLAEMRQMNRDRGNSMNTERRLLQEMRAEMQAEVQRTMQQVGDLRADANRIRSDSTLARQEVEMANQEFRNARAPLQKMATDLIRGEQAHFNQEMVTERVQAELRMLLETGRIQIPEQPDASVDPPADQRGAGLLSADSKAPDALAGAGGGQPGLSTEEPR